MITVFIFHGVGGHPGENWFPWLKDELDKDGYTVMVPAFPHSDHPMLDEWLDHFRQFETSVDGQAVFIGHSLGTAFALRFLERFPGTIAAAFLVAPVWETMGNRFDPLMTTFTAKPYDWAAIRCACNLFSVIQSDNDPYITLEKSRALTGHLGCAMTLVRGAGHFNAAAGYTQFPFLLERIRSVPET